MLQVASSSRWTGSGLPTRLPMVLALTLDKKLLDHVDGVLPLTYIMSCDRQRARRGGEDSA